MFPLFSPHLNALESFVKWEHQANSKALTADGSHLFLLSLYCTLPDIPVQGHSGGLALYNDYKDVDLGFINE